MSSQNKEILKLSEHGVVTGEAMLAYLRNELSAEDRQELERLLQDDPFARDAMEGLQGAPSKGTLAASLVSVNKKVRERSGAREKKKTFQLHWTTYAWAAVILGLLIAIGFVMVYMLGGNEKNLVSVNKTPEAEQSTPVIVAPQPVISQAADSMHAVAPTGALTSSLADSVSKLPTGIAFKPNVLGNNGSYIGTVAPTATNVGTVTMNAGTKAASPPSTGAVSGSGATGAHNTVPASTGTVFKSATVASDVVASANKPAPVANANQQSQSFARGSGTLNEVAINSSKAVRKDSSATAGKPADNAPNIDAAMQSFYNGDYKKSADAFDAVLKKDPDNSQALYFGGISDYINGQTAKSEESFDKILKKGTIFIDGAKWYKANILLKKGDREHAKVLLQDLSNSNGSYKERAVKKLAELNF